MLNAPKHGRAVLSSHQRSKILKLQLTTNLKTEMENKYILTEEEVDKANKAFEPRIPQVTKVADLLTHRRPEDTDSLGTYLEKNAEKFPENTAILFEDIKYTQKEFNEAINRYANYFLSLGLKKGDVVAILMDNRPEFLFLIGATAKIGAVSSLINTAQRSGTLKHSLTVVPTKYFIIGEECFDVFEEVRPGLEFTTERKLFYVPDKNKIDTPSSYIILPEAVRESDICNPGTAQKVMLKDRLVYIFTSGTTGLPKAAIITHYHTTSALHYWGHIVLEMKPEDIMYISLPMFHSNSFNIAFSAAIAGGSTMALSRRFSVTHFWKDIRKHKATAFNYIGEVCRYLINQPPKPDDLDNSIEKIAGNGMNNDIWKAFKNRFGIDKVYEQYGATEVNFALTNLFNLDCTIGTSLGSFAIVKYDLETEEPIKDGKGLLQRVDVGEVGLMLIEITSPLTFSGYTNRKATEKKTIRDAFTKGDLWMNTGDLLRDIGFGHAQFADRLGDTFRWKGENVSTDEVANVIIGFGQILQAAVYGVTIPNTDGRAGMASIVVDVTSEELDTKGLAQYLKQSLPSYAVPIFIRQKTKFQTTSTHKIQKNELKKEGFDPNIVSDRLYVLLPGSSQYVPLTSSLYEEIVNGEYRL